MKEFERLGHTIPEGAVELIGERNLYSKKFRLPDGRLNIKSAVGFLHYGSQLRDIDLAPENTQSAWVIQKAPYRLEIAKDGFAFLYRSAGGREIHAAIDRINGAVPVLSGVSKPHAIGHSIEFANALGDGDIFLLIHAGGIRTEQKIRSVNGAKSLLWKITQNFPEPIILETLVVGHDNEKRKADIEITRSSMSQSGGVWEHTFEQRFTGNTREIVNRRTREERVVAGSVYPVTIRG